MRVIKSHWKISLGTLIGIFALAIGIGFHYSSSLAIPLTLIGILPPTLYYFYRETLNRPLIMISSCNPSITVAPMYAGMEETGDEFIRPAIFYKIRIENEGKSTAERARIHARVSSSEFNRTYFARWAGPESTDEYDLLPGQSKDVHLLKIFVTSDFYERFEGFRSRIEEALEQDLDDVHINPQGNPLGMLREQDDIDAGEIRLSVRTPREQRPERRDSTIHGGWEGRELPLSDDIMSSEVSIDIRVIADDYKTDWKQGIDSFSIFNLVQSVAHQNQVWQDQWQNQGMDDLMGRIRIALGNWIDQRDFSR